MDDADQQYSAEDRLGIALARSENRLIRQLIAVRHSRGLKPAELARKMEVDRSVVTRFESGGTNPTMATINRYAEAVGAVIHHNEQEPHPQASPPPPRSLSPSRRKDDSTPPERAPPPPDRRTQELACSSGDQSMSAKLSDLTLRHVDPSRLMFENRHPQFGRERPVSPAIRGGDPGFALGGRDPFGKKGQKARRVQPCGG